MYCHRYKNATLQFIGDCLSKCVDKMEVNILDTNINAKVLNNRDHYQNKKIPIKVEYTVLSAEPKFNVFFLQIVNQKRGFKCEDLISNPTILVP